MSTVVIKIDGVDITADVQIAAARFSSQVNGAIGQASFRVKDADQTYDFQSGGSLTLDVDSVRVWGGYVMSAKKVYVLPTLDTTDPTILTRTWEILGSDYNILFTKRIVYDAGDPTGKLDFPYSVNTYDDTIIDDIFDNYLDIGSDGLTRSGVTRIGHAILDFPGRQGNGTIASAGYTWKEAMDVVARATGGVYYIDPSKDLHYVDVESVDSDYYLTDLPTTVSAVGYRDFMLLENGSDMVNDMLVWGAGSGSADYVFSRSQDATSISAHNRWQAAQNTSGLYRQTSADIVSNSYVYGTPQSHRGGKDDAISFTCRVVQPLFFAGERVRVVNGIFGYEDVLPIRQMVITFINPTEALFDLVLSHVIDLPNVIYEFLNIRIPPISGGGVTVTKPPPPPPVGGCECSITDAFDRSLPSDTDGPGFGLSTSGIRWQDLDGSGFDGFTVNAGVGTAEPSVAIGQVLALDGRGTMDVLLQFKATDTGTGNYFYIGLDYDGGSYYNYVEIDTTYPGYEHTIGAFREGDSGVQYSGTEVFDGSVVNWLRIHIDAAKVQAKVWATTDSEPGSWTIESTPGSPVAYPDTGLVAAFVLDTFSSGGMYDDVLDIGHLDITGINRCTRSQFETFDDRTLSNPTPSTRAMGTASPSGFPWHDNRTGLNKGAFTIDPVYKLYINASPTNDVDFYTLDGEGTPDPAPWRGAMDMVAKVRGTGVGANIAQEVFAFYVNDDEYLWLNFQNGLNEPSDVESIKLSTTEGGTDLGVVTTRDFAWEDLTDYLVRWQFLANTYSRVRVWKAIDAEPSDWLIDDVPVTDADAGDFGIWRNAGQSIDAAIEVFWVDFYYNGSPCYIQETVPVPPASGVPSSGRVCETFAGSAGQVDIQLANAFQRFTPEVTIAGYRKSRGADYTEYPIDGAIVLSSALSGGESIRVCYHANGVIL